MWSLAHRSLTTNDIFQRRRPNRNLCPQWCIMCRRNEESPDHLFLHCPVDLALQYHLFQMVDISWVASASCSQMLLINFRGFGCNKKARAFWSCVFFSIFWVTWLEPNGRVFQDKSCVVNSLRDRVCYLSAFRASISPPYTKHLCALVTP